MMKPCIRMIGSLLFLAMAAGCVFAQQGHDRSGRSLKVGDIAPTFLLMSVDGKEKTDLDEFRGKRPVVLFFGSYT